MDAGSTDHISPVRGTAVTSATPPDRRQSPRLPVFGADDVNVWADGAGGHARRRARLVDLGVGGAFLELEKGYPIGTCLSVRFQLVTLGEVNCRAIVRRDIDGTGVGVEFLNLAAPEQKRLSALFAKAKD